MVPARPSIARTNERLTLVAWVQPLCQSIVFCRVLPPGPTIELELGLRIDPNDHAAATAPLRVCIAWRCFDGCRGDSGDADADDGGGGDDDAGRPPGATNQRAARASGGAPTEEEQAEAHARRLSQSARMA